MTLPEYFRTQEELTKSFESGESPVRKAGLTLVSVEIKEFPLPERKLLLETGDDKVTARFMTEQTRAWSNSMFLSSKSNAKLDLRSILVLLGLPSTLIRHENRAFRKRSSNLRN